MAERRRVVVSRNRSRCHNIVAKSSTGFLTSLSTLLFSHLIPVQSRNESKTYIVGINKFKDTKVERSTCRVCLDDNLSPKRLIVLSCHHLICHKCIRRMFVLSTQDPACMPPKCCTSRHISLRNVEHLFSPSFKMNWNDKYEEYKTSNRLYCPKTTCGVWNSPKDFQIDRHNPDVKFCVCRGCKLKICCGCGNRYHRSTSCPIDKDIAIFLETAEERGWRQCYKCKVMIELDQGCNHMTCRCTAEFCMKCGQKWKTCDCPWFNSSRVDNDHDDDDHDDDDDDDEDHDEDDDEDLSQSRPPGELEQTLTYHQELERIRLQTERDFELAQRLERYLMDDDDDYSENGSNHFMDTNYMRNNVDSTISNVEQYRVW